MIPLFLTNEWKNMQKLESLVLFLCLVSVNINVVKGSYNGKRTLEDYSEPGPSSQRHRAAESLFSLQIMNSHETIPRFSPLSEQNVRNFLAQNDRKVNVVEDIKPENFFNFLNAYITLHYKMTDRLGLSPLRPLPKRSKYLPLDPSLPSHHPINPLTEYTFILNFISDDHSHPYNKMARNIKKCKDVSEGKPYKFSSTVFNELKTHPCFPHFLFNILLNFDFSYNRNSPCLIQENITFLIQYLMNVAQDNNNFYQIEALKYFLTKNNNTSDIPPSHPHLKLVQVSLSKISDQQKMNLYQSLFEKIKHGRKTEAQKYFDFLKKNYINLYYSDNILNFLKEIAEIPNHPFQIEALFFILDELDIRNKRSHVSVDLRKYNEILETAVHNLDLIDNPKILLLLLQKSVFLEKVYKSIDASIDVISDYFNDVEFYEIMSLLGKHNEELFTIILERLKITDQRSFFDIVNKLIPYDLQELKVILLSTIVRTHHPDRFHAAIALDKMPRSETKANISTAEIKECIKSFALQDGHEFQFDAMTKFLTPNVETVWHDLSHIIQDILKTPSHPHFWKVLEMLISDLKKQSVKTRKTIIEDKEKIIFPVVYELAADPSAFHQFYAMETIFDNWYPKLDDASKSTLRNQIAHYVNNPNRNPNWRRYLIQMLREQNDPLDQELGLSLMMHNFPVAMDAALKHRIDFFNQDTFKQTRKLPLEDLSRLDIDLPQRFSDLMSGIEVYNTSAPNYLHISSIIGEIYPDEENQNSFLALYYSVMGFLKTLVGQPLIVGETAGWQMYDENKLAMINTLKHLVLALENTSDIPTRLHNLGIVLNGLLYCPTGQAEGLNTAVNTLIHGRLQRAEDMAFEEILAKCIHEAVEKIHFEVFGRLAHYGSNVHSLARSRMILRPHIGLSQAVEGFRERISKIEDAEIPGILKEFYEYFTPLFLANYLKTHIETGIDSDLDLAIKQQKDVTPAMIEQHQNANINRPLKISHIANWLRQHGKDEEHYGMNDDVMKPNFDGMTLQHVIQLLKDTGYLRS